MSGDRARRAADLARRASLAVELLATLAVLGWLAGWHGVRVAGAGLALLALGWLLRDDVPTTTGGGTP